MLQSIICFSCEYMEPIDDSNGLCEPKDDSNGGSKLKGLFIKDRKQDQVELRFNSLYYTVSLGIGKGELQYYIIFYNLILFILMHAYMR